MKRYLSLDFLRGLSIFGMVFSAIIPHGNLPAWMYHIQNPPPTHALDMTVAGISWVDLVFPVFIFCMGVAIPIAGKRRIEKSVDGKATASFLGATFERFIMLWLFSYIYVFLSYSNVDDWKAQLLTILGFAALFPLYMVSKKKSTLLRLVGLILVCGIITIGHYAFGEVISVQRRGIIIFLLAFIYFFGSLAWYFTRDSGRKRILAISIVLVITIITQQLDLPAKAYANPAIRWWFNPEYIYFLLILLPATMIGEHIIKRQDEDSITPAKESKIVEPLYYLLTFAVVVWLVYAFYKQIWLANFITTALSVTILVFIGKKHLPKYNYMIVMTAVLLLLGFIFEPLDGGIKKVPCTISYCFITCAISIMLLIVCDYLCKIAPKGFLTKIFTGAGSNPLMSYIAFDNLVMPFMKLTGIIYLYRAAYPPDMPWIGTIRAFIITLITMWIVSLFSRKKIYWKA